MAAAEATAADTPCAVAVDMVADTAVVPRCAAAAIMVAAPRCAAADIAAGTPFAAEGDIMAAALRCAAHACTSGAGTMAARDLADAQPDRGLMPDAPSGLRIRLDAPRTSGATHIAAPRFTAARGRSIGLRLRAATTAASPEER